MIKNDNPLEFIVHVTRIYPRRYLLFALIFVPLENIYLKDRWHSTRLSNQLLHRCAQQYLLSKVHVYIKLSIYRLWLVYCIYLYYILLEHFSLINISNGDARLQNLFLWSAFMVLEQWQFFMTLWIHAIFAVSSEVLTNLIAVFNKKCYWRLI